MHREAMPGSRHGFLERAYGTFRSMAVTSFTRKGIPLLLAVGVVLVFGAFVVQRNPDVCALFRTTSCDEPAPINDVDPVTGKRVDPGAGTAAYKGYTIGFCCPLSRDEGAWERMNEQQKDAFVGRFVGPRPTAGDRGMSMSKIRNAKGDSGQRSYVRQ